MQVSGWGRGKAGDDCHRYSRELLWGYLRPSAVAQGSLWRHGLAHFWDTKFIKQTTIWEEKKSVEGSFHRYK